MDMLFQQTPLEIAKWLHNKTRRSDALFWNPTAWRHFKWSANALLDLCKGHSTPEARAQGAKWADQLRGGPNSKGFDPIQAKKVKREQHIGSVSDNVMLHTSA